MKRGAGWILWFLFLPWAASTGNGLPNSVTPPPTVWCTRLSRSFSCFLVSLPRESFRHRFACFISLSRLHYTSLELLCHIVHKRKRRLPQFCSSSSSLFCFFFFFWLSVFVLLANMQQFAKEVWLVLLFFQCDSQCLPAAAALLGNSHADSSTAELPFLVLLAYVVIVATVVHSLQQVTAAAACLCSLSSGY